MRLGRGESVNYIFGVFFFFFCMDLLSFPFLLFVLYVCWRNTMAFLGHFNI